MKKLDMVFMSSGLPGPKITNVRLYNSFRYRAYTECYRLSLLLIDNEYWRKHATHHVQ